MPTSWACRLGVQRYQTPPGGRPAAPAPGSGWSAHPRTPAPGPAAWRGDEAEWVRGAGRWRDTSGAAGVAAACLPEIGSWGVPPAPAAAASTAPATAAAQPASAAWLERPAVPPPQQPGPGVGAPAGWWGWRPRGAGGHPGKPAGCGRLPPLSSALLQFEGGVQRQGPCWLKMSALGWAGTGWAGNGQAAWLHLRRLPLAAIRWRRAAAARARGGGWRALHSRRSRGSAGLQTAGGRAVWPADGSAASAAGGPAQHAQPQQWTACLRAQQLLPLSASEESVQLGQSYLSPVAV